MILKYKSTEGEWALEDDFRRISWKQAEVYWDEAAKELFVEKDGCSVYPDILQYTFVNVYENPGKRYPCYWIIGRNSKNDCTHFVVGFAYIMNDDGKTIEVIQ